MAGKWAKLSEKHKKNRKVARKSEENKKLKEHNIDAFYKAKKRYLWEKIREL